MKALIVAPRFPWPMHTGDRLRSTIWLEALTQHCEVALVAPSGKVPSGALRFRYYAAQRSLKRLAQGAAAVLRERLPFQCLLSAPYDWTAAIDRARRDAGPFDVTVILLSRMHPWVRKSIEGRTVLDAVDSLRRSAMERSKAARPGLKWFWRAEERRMARAERHAAEVYDRVVVVNEDETGDFARAVAVTNGIMASPLGSGLRTFDFGFWGRLPYFANADATAWLLDEIWPAICALNPSATLVIGGAGASRPLRNAAARRGVTLISPIEDVAEFARNIRIALMPVRFGSGQSTKALEAAEAGCAIVGTKKALRGLPSLEAHSVIEGSADGLARAAVQLLADEDRRALLSSRLRQAIETDYARSATLDRLRAIAGMTESA